MSDAPKGILKRHPQTSVNPVHSGSKGIRFDEDDLYEYDQHRGKTQKIMEPKTPFIHYDSNKDQVIGTSSEIPPIELERALMQAASPTEAEDYDWKDEHEISHNGNEGDGGNKDEFGDNHDESDNHEHFDALRHKHYDMKNALQKGKDLLEHDEIA